LGHKDIRIAIAGSKKPAPVIGLDFFCQLQYLEVPLFVKASFAVLGYPPAFITPMVRCSKT